MDVALLNTRITLQKNSVVKDPIGNRMNAWTDFFSCYSTLGGESGSESVNAGTVNDDAKCTFTVRWCSETAVIDTTHYRIIHNGEIYNIVRIDHQNNKHRSMKLHAEKVRR